ncbi:unnamed protein product, partial [Meganyctiphanes norvegica]
MTECLPDSTTVCDKTVTTKYKVVIIGDGGTGKSSYVARLQSEDFYHEYVATMGVEKCTISVETTHGEFTLVLWDTAGQEKLGPLRDGYYADADAAILFFDVTSRVTYKNIPGWHKDIVRVSPDIPIVLCANKVDVQERKVKSKSIKYHDKYRMGFFEISVKKRTLLQEPLEYLLQQLSKEPELKVIGSLDASLFDNVVDISLI